MSVLKWFWTSINFRKWTFEGRELNNPFIILWRIIIFLPLHILFIFAAILLVIAGERYAAETLINDYTMFDI